MRRYQQTLNELLSSLSNIDSSWKDKLADSIIGMLQRIPVKETYNESDICALLDEDYESGITIIRLFLDMSKDEFTSALRNKVKGIGKSQYRKNSQSFIAVLEELKLYSAMQKTVSRPIAWYDTLVERLKTGRGSAIKGQVRGRMLEDHVEGVVKNVFREYDLRCRFTGATEQSTEKTDFAIPSKSEPRILIEAKAYGATGSKQTDVLGDISRICEEKRHDTDFLLVTDGVTWHARTNDLRKLVTLQNQGKIGRIYTLNMTDELQKDLIQLKKDHAL